MPLIGSPYFMSFSPVGTARTGIPFHRCKQSIAYAPAWHQERRPALYA